MFTLHGKTYHRIFDLQQLYEDMNVSNSGRPNLNDPSSPTPYIEFADVSRINDGPVLGEQVSAPDIAALVYASGQQDSGKRAAVSYPVNSPDPKPRVLPLWNPAYETLQFPLLFLHGESGWSEGHSKDCLLYTSPSPRDRG